MRILFTTLFAIAICMIGNDVMQIIHYVIENEAIRVAVDMLVLELWVLIALCAVSVTIHVIDVISYCANKDSTSG